jgi:hypothetical protein
MVKLSMVPVSITAKTKEDLTLAMLNNNIQKSKQFTYFDIQKDGKEWIAWYYNDVYEEALKQNG